MPVMVYTTPHHPPRSNRDRLCDGVYRPRLIDVVQDEPKLEIGGFTGICTYIRRLEIGTLEREGG